MDVHISLYNSLYLFLLVLYCFFLSILCIFFFFFFFFQAEDGIRDLYVTGVQTCALPISRRAARSRRWAKWKHNPALSQRRRPSRFACSPERASGKSLRRRGGGSIDRGERTLRSRA